MFNEYNERRFKSIKVILEGIIINEILRSEMTVKINPKNSKSAREFFTFLDETERSLLYLSKEGP